MNSEQFIAKWRGITRTERSAAQEHFLDLCDLLEVPKPGEVDRHGTEYTFEKSIRKIGDTIGFADVWKRHCFAWEYKGSRKNLVQAYAQLKQYADALDNPPLLIVSDMQEIRVHTNFTNAIAQQHVIPLAELPSVEARALLRNCFLYPERLLPTATRESVTAQAAANFANIAVLLRRHYDERRVAHFINKLIFCLFAEDIDLLPDRIFADILDEARKRPDDFAPMLRDLFRAMANRNGRFGAAAIPWFNGGLFDDDDVLPLGIGAVADLMTAARLDWKAIDPTIFGTLFESGLDDKKRAQMASLFDAPEPEEDAQPRLFAARAADRGVGIHYTDETTIMKIIEPVVVAPLRREWERVKAEIGASEQRRARARSPAEQSRLLAEARGLYSDFRTSLGHYRVLDPACGSGNFLALSLRALKDFDLQVLDDAAAMGLPRDEFRVGPEAVRGIEINGYAAELARLTVWITELQWQLRKGLGLTRRPILDRLDGIVWADALLTQSGSDSPWPEADVVVGNPPFLGGKRMRSSLGGDYVDRLFSAFAGRVPAEADLVAYWFAKAWERLRDGRLNRAGLVGTNSMRGGANRRVLDAIVKDGIIFDAWDDEPWVIKGVAVRVSLICFGADTEGQQPQLDGRPVKRIGSDLTASRSDLTTARRLTENKGVAFMGDTKGGAFDVPGDLARLWLQLPLNPNGRPNSDVLRPWMNGMDVTRNRSGRWIIDFGSEMSEREAALFEAPFAYCLAKVKPERDKNRREAYRRFWWRHVEPRPGMARALKGLGRFVVTPEVSKHRIFAWLRPPITPDHKLQVIASDADPIFGILLSQIHKWWSLRVGSWHGVGNDPRYTIGTTFETFPFPEGLTPNIPAAEYADDPRAAAIDEAARRLDELRGAWLNPPDLVERVPEVVPGYPDRILPVNAKAAAILKKRTLTNLYNERPTWLDNAHRDLDAAVAAAYGWPADLSEEEALARLLALNLERAAAQ
ncbi:MAG: class I SAM-dependent DNA methyltransferase [Stellaceae bacterium]